MKPKARIVRAIIIVAAVVAFVSTVVLLFSLFDQKDYLFVQDDDMYFGKLFLGLRAEKGKPIESTVSDASPSRTYYYKEDIRGYEAWCCYEYFRFGLIKAEYIFEDIEYSSALSITEEIANNQKKYYSSYEGYHCSDMQVNEDGTFSLTLGVTTTPEIIRFIYTFDGDRLTIRARKHV